MFIFLIDRLYTKIKQKNYVFVSNTKIDEM